MTRRPMTSRLVPALLAGVLALGATACGGSSSGGSASGGTSTSAAAEGGAASSAKVGDEISAKDLGARVQKAMQEAGTAKFSGENQGSTLTGEIDVKKTAYSMKGAQEGEAMEAILVDGVMYIGGAGMSELTGGKKFAKIDPNGTDPMSKLMAPMLDQVKELADPSAGLTAIEGLTSKVTAVDGEQVTYTTTLTGEQVWKLAQKGLEGQTPSTSPNAETIKGMAATLVQVLDAKDRPVKVEVTTKTGDKEQKQTFTYRDWGAPVSITAPDPADVGVFNLPSAS